MAKDHNNFSSLDAIHPGPYVERPTDGKVFDARGNEINIKWSEEDLRLIIDEMQQYVYKLFAGISDYFQGPSDAVVSRNESSAVEGRNENSEVDAKRILKEQFYAREIGLMSGLTGDLAIKIAEIFTEAGLGAIAESIDARLRANRLFEKLCLAEQTEEQSLRPVLDTLLGIFSSGKVNIQDIDTSVSSDPAGKIKELFEKSNRSWFDDAWRQILDRVSHPDLYKVLVKFSRRLGIEIDVTMLDRDQMKLLENAKKIVHDESFIAAINCLGTIRKSIDPSKDVNWFLLKTLMMEGGLDESDLRGLELNESERQRLEKFSL